MKYIISALFFLSCCLLQSCSGAEDLLDLASGDPSRRPIDSSRMGVNNFFVNTEFGSISTQFSDIRDNLGLRFVRILIACTNDVLPSASSSPRFGFFDDIISAIPPGVDVLVTVAHAPDWMGDSSNWIAGNPRHTWIESCFRPMVERYAGTPGITGWQIWNEPNQPVLPADGALELAEPINYHDLLTFGSAVVRSTDPTKLVVMAATTSIQQNYPTTLSYNRSLFELGAESLIDVWAIHYYSQQYESVVRDSGVANFLNSLSSAAIWVTESGEQGPNNQLAYVETTWPFLREKIPGIDRIYYYEYGSTTAVDLNFGLYTNDPVLPVSDLREHLVSTAG